MTALVTLKKETSESVSRDMAERIAQHSFSMGLDDIDEAILWRYLHHLSRITWIDVEETNIDRLLAAWSDVPMDLIQVLIEQGEMAPHLVVSQLWTATIPERFYNKRRKLLSRLGMPLRLCDGFDIRFAEPQRALLINSAEGYEQQLIDTLKVASFRSWYKDITACIREDGVNWEPPCADDVDIQLKVYSIPMREVLERLI